MIDKVQELSRRLRDVVIHREAFYRYAYNYDATGRKGDCMGVAFPDGLDQLVRIVREASSMQLPLFMRGAGTGFSGGSVPVGGGIVVSTEKMGRVTGLDREGGTVEVECGIVNRQLQTYLEPFGLFYPPDPASLKVSTLGGNVAENAGGPRAYKYGVTRRYVRSMVWIDPSGEVLETPLEGVASLMVGAEGTLGVIYSVRLSVLPLPSSFRTFLVCAGSDTNAMHVASGLLSEGFCPSVMEFIDSKTMKCVSEYRKISAIDTSQSYLFTELDGNRDETGAQQAILEGFCRKNGLFVIAAGDEIERDMLWELRRSISPSLARQGITKVNEDVSLPLGKLADAVSFIKDASDELNLDCYIFGHSGDGNLHVNIMTDRRKKDEMKRAGIFVERLFARVAELGGTLSGEHGIGITKNRYLEMLFSPDEIDIQKNIKKAIDPGGFLNTGKYFSGV